MNLVYNRFTNETSLTADELRIKIAGGVPDFGNAPFEQTVFKLTTLGMFSGKALSKIET